MPQQVWRTEDGTIFNSQIEAIRYEESDELSRNFYDDKGKRKEQLPDISHLRGDFGTAISARLMQMFLKEFTYLAAATNEIDGFNELGSRLKDLQGSMWLFPDE